MSGKVFLNLNAMGTVPLLQDVDFNIAESHTIMKYLLHKYGNKEQQTLYPTELRERALVDQAMYFDTGVAFIRVKCVFLPIVFDGVKEVTPKMVEDIEEVYSIVEDHLSLHQYIALDRLTITDFSVGTTITALNATHKIDTKRNVAVPGADILKQVLKTYLEKNDGV